MSLIPPFEFTSLVHHLHPPSPYEEMVGVQVYVRSKILAVAGSASLGRRLGMNPEAVRQAFADVLTEGIALRSSDQEETVGPALQLSFGHECQ
jgi:hypothetical protein